MNRQKYFSHILVLLLLVVGSACAEKSSVKKKQTTDTQPQTPVIPNPWDGGGGGGNNNNGQTGAGEGYGNGSEAGISDGGQTTQYYTVSNIVVHGTGNPNRNAPPNGILWSSRVNFPSSDEHIFSTNSRFNLRVLPRPGPAQNSNDVRGVSCRYANSIYKKLQIDVCVRSRTGSCNNFNTVTFTEVPLNQTSKVKEFTVPVTSDPLVVEIRDVQWDYTCVYYGENVAGYCPFAPVWDTQCVKFDFQFSTDETKDIPGPRM